MRHEDLREIPISVSDMLILGLQRLARKDHSFIGHSSIARNMLSLW